MPIPLGARLVRGQPNRVLLADGATIVTRAAALTMGAAYMGYRSNYDYRKHVSGDRNYVNAWLNTEQGQRALQRERDIAAAEGRSFNRAQFDQRVIAARNARAHPRSDRAAREPFVDFSGRYDLTDHDELELMMY